jgi:hypothetical protein
MFCLMGFESDNNNNPPFHYCFFLQAYVSALGSMHKVVLGAESEADLVLTEQRLSDGGVAFHCWVEEPEHIK